MAAEPDNANLPATDPERKPFAPEVLDRTVIAIPLLRDIKADRYGVHDVIIDLNLSYAGGREAARSRVEELLGKAVATTERGGDEPPVDLDRLRLDDEKSKFTNQYLFASIEGDVIEQIVRLDGERDGDEEMSRSNHAIYRIWPDFPIHPLLTKSASTVKADAARNAFGALGEDIVWAVMDSGIQGDHPHFEGHGNLKLELPLTHQDFSTPGGTAVSALKDEFGHGTHVAGILGGEYAGEESGRAVRGRRRAKAKVFAAARHRDECGNVTVDSIPVERISGMAPKCKLISLKVLDAAGKSASDKAVGKSSSLIAAIAYIQTMNDHGRMMRIHGVNMSVGYDFEPEWFACGQSPLCVEVDRLVKSGVVVVVAAGNTGYGYTATKFKGNVACGMDLTINDPGNAELAITVGSTHREMPHVYGVSYFSSKGPTGDGRRKPDLVAPGEKILSCATPRPLQAMQSRLDAGKDYQYVEDSGTSMAAPHVSGVIAAFLSIRREFIGRPERVKEIFLATATDLGRDVYFQGRGLVDLMRALQSV